MQMNDQNKLTIKTKERAKRLNELTNELVAVSLFDSNLLYYISLNDIFLHFLIFFSPILILNYFGLKFHFALKLCLNLTVHVICWVFHQLK